MKTNAVVRFAARVVDHPIFGRIVMALILLAAVATRRSRLDGDGETARVHRGLHDPHSQDTDHRGRPPGVADSATRPASHKPVGF